MTTEAIYDLWCGVSLRLLIDNLAKAFSKNTDEQKTLKAMAWIAVGELYDGKTQEYYIQVAYSAMRRYYEIYQMPPPKRWVSDDAGIRRANAKLRQQGPIVGTPPILSTYTNEGP